MDEVLAGDNGQVRRNFKTKLIQVNSYKPYKLYQEFGLGSLRLWCSYKKLWLSYKAFKNDKYIFHVILACAPYTARTVHNLDILKTKHTFLKNYFFPSTSIPEWNKLDASLRSSESFLAFEKNILQFISSAVNSMYKCHNPKEIKLIKQLRLGLRYLKGYKFKHNSQEFLNLLYNCRHGIESSTCFFLYC